MLLAALFLASIQDVKADAAVENRLPLSVLYAGDTAHDRARHWIAFLRKHFVRVDSVFLDDLSNQAAAEFDVVVADWRPRRLPKGASPADREPENSNTRAWLPIGFTRPVVAIGAVGGELGLQHKFEWF